MNGSLVVVYECILYVASLLDLAVITTFVWLAILQDFKYMGNPSVQTAVYMRNIFNAKVALFVQPVFQVQLFVHLCWFQVVV